LKDIQPTRLEAGYRPPDPISLTPGFNQVIGSGLLIPKPFQRFTSETVETVIVPAVRSGHRTEVRC
jgi:hypothetical protein